MADTRRVELATKELQNAQTNTAAGVDHGASPQEMELLHAVEAVAVIRLRLTKAGTEEDAILRDPEYQAAERRRDAAERRCDAAKRRADAEAADARAADLRKKVEEEEDKDEPDDRKIERWTKRMTDAKAEAKEARADADTKEKEARDILHEAQGRGSEAPPAEKYFGYNPVVMTVDGVHTFLKNLQRDKNIRYAEAHILADDDLALQLVNRDRTVSAMVKVFQKRREAHEDSCDDRTRHPIPVFSGMPGLGKTRMLEEWLSIFKKANIPAQHVGVIVSYGNGGAPKEIEDRMPIEASFSWRMLYRLFLRDNSEIWAWFELLPCNADKLTLKIALDVIRLEFADNGNLSLFIGVDEYQKIPDGPSYDRNNKSSDRFQSYLWQLLVAFDSCKRMEDITIYPALAGTKWGPLSLSGVSSVAEVERMPLPLLGSVDMETVLSSSDTLCGLLHHTCFVRRLAMLGGVPRPCIRFACDVKAISSDDEVKEAYETNWKKYIQCVWGNLLVRDHLLLVAHAVSGTEIDENAISPVKVSEKEYTWFRLIEHGFCMHDEGVVIPYSAFTLASRSEFSNALSPAERCLLQNLKFLHDHVDTKITELESWELWERFGACFFALRVNSLLMVGKTVVPFSSLIRGAISNGCDMDVVLEPMEVHSIDDKLGPDMNDSVNDRCGLKRYNWLKGDNGVRYCLINGNGGEGVDVFSALQLANKSEYVLYLDQRKRVAESIGGTRANKYFTKMSPVIPKCLPDGSVTVCGLFTLLASYNESSDTLPLNSFLVSYKELDTFHRSLSSHPACWPYVFVNRDNKSTLELLSSVKAISSEIIAVRQVPRIFRSVDDFANFCKDNNYDLSEGDRLRVRM